MNRTLAVFLILYMAVCFTAGFAAHAFFFKAEPVKAVKKKVEKYYAVGVPDTASKAVIQKAKVKIKKSDNGYEIKSDNEDLTVTDFKIDPPVEHAEADIEAKVIEKYITRTDTMYVAEETEKEYEKDESWSLEVGGRHVFAKNYEPVKYAMVNYQKKIWFFFVGGSMGIQNQFNEGLNNLKIAANVELNIPLN